MRTVVLIRIGLALLALTPLLAQSGSAARPNQQLGGQARAVDVVIALDTSGSMENLLDATRARIWDVVNELGRLKPTPELRVGLLSFGTDKASEEQGFIVRHLDLTGDLDEVYAQLSSLTIGGGTELVGRVLNEAIDGMQWSPEPSALRVIFVAGNESADQGAEHDDFRAAARAAGKRDIIVNALYAGSREQGVAEKWPEIAQTGKGNFSAIDPAKSTIQIATPQDALLLDLNAKLNATYVPYGDRGAAGLANQVAQDGNATRLGVQSCSSRIVAKGGALYDNASWDLVDRSLDAGFVWEEIPLRDLPENLQAMTVAQRSTFVEAKRGLRETIQTQIQQASDQREAYIRGTMFGDPGLGEAMRKVIRGQALAKGFTCEGC